MTRRSTGAAATPDSLHQAEELIRRIAAGGDRDAFARLFAEFAPKVKAYQLRMGLDEVIAEELAHDTLLAVWRKAGSFDAEVASASSWIFAIARNSRIDFLRRRPLAEAGEEPAASYATSPEEEMNRSQTVRGVAAALTALTHEQAEVIELALLEEQSHSEISRRLGLPLGTVKFRIRAAMQQLRALLKGFSE